MTKIIHHIVYADGIPVISKAPFTAYCGEQGIPAAFSWAAVPDWNLDRILSTHKKRYHTTIMCEACLKLYPEIAPLELLKEANV
jgi:hemolysin-activating ACP:hemolysin acyltransferase